MGVQLSVDEPGPPFCMIDKCVLYTVGMADVLNNVEGASGSTKLEMSLLSQ